MARTLQRLNSLAISRAKLPGYLADGGGLYLQVTPAGNKSWILRFSRGGRRREMGLGPFPAVGLAEARQKAAEGRSTLKAGKDPIAEREATRARQRLLEERGVTFDRAAEIFIESHEATWANDKHRQQWRNTLATYASPVMGGLSVAGIGIAEVTRILEPLWRSKPETASRLRGRIERVLDWAKVRGYRDGENPARWRGHLDKVLPAHNKVRRVKHHAAVPIDEMPAVYARLCEAQGIAALAVRFTILTAVRAGETTGASWPEVDLRAGVWSIPAARMKAARDHRVPLSREARAILSELERWRTDGRLFPGQRAGRPLSIAALSKALKSVVTGYPATTHGCRSTFKDWATERTGFPFEVSEMALAHAISDKAEAAYRRGELMKKREAMMQAWATFVSTPRQAENVVTLSQAAA